MRCGACTWIFGDGDLATMVSFLAETGFDGVELRGDLQLYQPADVSTLLGDHSLTLLSLTSEDVDLVHPDARVREGALDFCLRLLDIPAAVGLPLVSCHSPVGRVWALVDYEADPCMAILDAGDASLRSTRRLIARLSGAVTPTMWP